MSVLVFGAFLGGRWGWREERREKQRRGGKKQGCAKGGEEKSRGAAPLLDCSMVADIVFLHGFYKFIRTNPSFLR
jgi:hypothetical protein